MVDAPVRLVSKGLDSIVNDLAVDEIVVAGDYCKPDFVQQVIGRSLSFAVELDCGIRRLIDNGSRG